MPKAERVANRLLVYRRRARFIPTSSSWLNLIGRWFAELSRKAVRCVVSHSFFSVFTHVSHEHTYLYLEEAKRLLRPGGLVIFSFLEFFIPSHWTQFESAVRSFGSNSVPNVFLDRHAIIQFAHYLDWEIVEFADGDKPTFPIDEEIAYANGHKQTGRGSLGQSIAVLRKR